MCCFLFTRQPSAICARPLIILMSSLPALQSTFSSSRLCWFTTATCTQDISSRTAAAPPRLPQPSARSGCGCRTTRCEKPACTRCCLPTRTCSSTRESEDWTSLCARRSDRKLPASQPGWLQPFPVKLSQLYVSYQQLDYNTVTTRAELLWSWWCVMEHNEGHHGLILNPWVDSFFDPEQEAVIPKDYGPKGRVDENLWSHKQLLFDGCNNFC